MWAFISRHLLEIPHKLKIRTAITEQGNGSHCVCPVSEDREIMMRLKLFSTQRSVSSDALMTVNESLQQMTNSESNMRPDAKPLELFGNKKGL